MGVTPGRPFRLQREHGWQAAVHLLPGRVSATDPVPEGRRTQTHGRGSVGWRARGAAQVRLGGGARRGSGPPHLAPLSSSADQGPAALVTLWLRAGRTPGSGRLTFRCKPPQPPDSRKHFKRLLLIKLLLRKTEK